VLTAPELGAFMVSACVVTAAIWHPAWPVRQSIQDPLVRRVLAGIAMACTAVCIIYSAWGKRSSAYFNPSVTLTFFRLGKVKPWDALFCMRAQFTGGVLGVRVAAQLLGATIKHSGRPGGRLAPFGRAQRHPLRETIRVQDHATLPRVSATKLDSQSRALHLTYRLIREVKQNSFLGDKPYELHRSCQYPLSRESAGGTTSTPRSIRCKLLLMGHLRAKDWD